MQGSLDPDKRSSQGQSLPRISGFRTQRKDISSAMVTCELSLLLWIQALWSLNVPAGPFGYRRNYSTNYLQISKGGVVGAQAALKAIFVKDILQGCRGVVQLVD